MIPYFLLLINRKITFPLGCLEFGKRSANNLAVASAFGHIRRIISIFLRWIIHDKVHSDWLIDYDTVIEYVRLIELKYYQYKVTKNQLLLCCEISY